MSVWALASISALWPVMAQSEFDWCSPNERARLAVLSAPGRRRQFLAGRWLLRHLLSDAFGGDPCVAWPLSADVDAPPRLLDASGAALHLSLSHSGDWVACAASAEPIGVDIESPRRSRPVMSLARLVCSAQEAAQLAAVPPGPAQEALFYRYWTIKEAVLKRDGLALVPSVLSAINPSPCQGLPDEAAAQAWTWQTDQFTVAIASRAMPARAPSSVPAVSAGQGRLGASLASLAPDAWWLAASH